jgi:hypothetical protein
MYKNFVRKHGKEMNNEPVAYFVKNKQGWWAETDKDTGIPLYTHPVSKAKDRFPNYESICLQCGTTIYKPFKQLTDEEIDNISDEIPHYIDTYMGRRMFARAILIKAQEK